MQKYVFLWNEMGDYDPDEGAYRFLNVDNSEGFVMRSIWTRVRGFDDYHTLWVRLCSFNLVVFAQIAF